MRKFKITYHEGLFDRSTYFVEADSQKQAWLNAVHEPPRLLMWYKKITVKEVYEPTAERYAELKETALWGWGIAFALVGVIAWILN